jgi:flagellar basal-body rod protein FlgB
MILEGLTLIETAKQRIDYLNKRHNIVAENVANADTPGYRTQDLLPFEAALKSAASGTPARTHGAHLVGLNGPEGFKADRKAEGWEMAPAGNSVVLEQEMLKASEIQGAHALVSNLYKKHVDMMRMAVQSR